jgi:hypothetical protein
MKVVLLAIVPILLATSCGHAPAPAAQQTPILRAGEFPIPAGTEFRVRVAEPVTTEKAEAGGRFLAKLDDGLVIGGRQVAPPGAEATLRVIEAESGRRGGREARVTLRLTQVWPGTGAPAIDLHTAPVTRTNQVAGTHQLATTHVVPGLIAPDPNMVHVEIAEGTVLAFVLESPAVVSTNGR